MGRKSLPPGFRFHPTDIELVKYHLKRKVLGKKLRFNAIAEVDIYKHAPWDLPDMSCLKTGDLKWFFYCPVEKKYARGARLNRATVDGYWKTTGKDRPVKCNGGVVGMIKTLVFHRGKAPRGDRTDWVMHEYRLEEKDLADRGVVQDTYVLCVVFKKNGMGPRNGAQYGAPFKEEDWSDDDDEEDANLPGTGTLSGMSPAFGGACNSWLSDVSNACAGPTCGDAQVPQVEESNDNILPMLDMFTEEDAMNTYDMGQMLDMFTEEDAMNTYDMGQMLDMYTEEDAMDTYDVGPMLDMYTEEDAMNTYDMGQMTGVATDSFLEASQVTDDDDISILLASFTEDNDLNNVLYPSE